MDLDLLKFYGVKISNLLNDLKGNKYSDERLNEHQNTLLELFDKINTLLSSPDFDVNNNSNLETIKIFYQFLEFNITYLEDSTLNVIPFETIYCLDRALHDWLFDDINYVLVTTLRYNNYFYNGFLAFDDTVYESIKLFFNLDFKYRLIQISVPHKDVQDYYLNGVLYHELGHFIDNKYKITQRIIDSKYRTLTTSSILKVYYHLGEYFADLFSAQYSPLCIQNALKYVAYGVPESDTHPSTKKRIDTINDFVLGKPNNTISELNFALNNTVKRQFEKRYVDINYNDFYNLVPPIINTDEELHGLFNSVWDIWINYKSKFNGMNDNTIYKLLNNLIEKSISNYIVQKEWRLHASTKK